MRALVTGQVIQDHHVALLQGRCELGFHIDVECRTVHRAVDDPGCGQPVMAQGSDKGLRAPMTKRSMIEQSFTTRGPAGPFGHVGFQPGLVDEG